MDPVPFCWVIGQMGLWSLNGIMGDDPAAVFGATRCPWEVSHNATSEESGIVTLSGYAVFRAFETIVISDDRKES